MWPFKGQIKPTDSKRVQSQRVSNHVQLSERELNHLGILLSRGPGADRATYDQYRKDAVRKVLTESLGIADVDHIAIRRGFGPFSRLLRLDDAPKAFIEEILSLHRKGRLTRENLGEYVGPNPQPKPEPVKAKPVDSDFKFDLLKGSQTASEVAKPVVKPAALRIQLSDEALFKIRRGYLAGNVDPNQRKNRENALNFNLDLLRNEFGFHADVSEADLARLRVKASRFWKMGFRGGGDQLDWSVGGNPQLKDNPFLALRIIQHQNGAVRLSEMFDLADADTHDVEALREKIRDCYYFKNGTRAGFSSLLLSAPGGGYQERAIDSLNLSEARKVLGAIRSELDNGRKLSEVSVLNDVSGQKENLLNIPHAPQPKASAASPAPSRWNVFKRIGGGLALLGALVAGESYLVNNGLGPSNAPSRPTVTPSASVKLPSRADSKDVRQLMRQEFARHWNAMPAKVRAAHAKLGWESDALADWWVQHRASIGKPIKAKNAPKAANDLAYPLMKLTERAVRNGTVHAVPTMFASKYIDGGGNKGVSMAEQRAFKVKFGLRHQAR